MAGHRSLTELVRRHAAEQPGRDALVVVDESGRADRVDYARLDCESRTLAAWLHIHGAVGERVLIQQPDAHQFVVSFLACLYAGAIAVPGPNPGGLRHSERRVLGIVRDAGVRFALTDARNAGAASQALALGGYGEVTCVATDTLLSLPTAPDPADWRMPEIGPETTALLQYTSGSSGDPRGVVVRHANLLANQAAIQQLLRTGPDTAVGGWLPLHHDLGLIGQLLHPLWLGATSVLMSPVSFAKRPANWLRLISEHRLAVSAGPNFGYDLCLRKITDEQLDGVDLSGWRCAVNGGEPVRPETMSRFAERFAPFGLRAAALRAGYGLAEATLMVACGSGDRAPGTIEADRSALEQGRLWPPSASRPGRTLTSSGRVCGLEVRIVDPQTRAEVADGSVGEIWLRGPSIAAGYWGRPRESAEGFAACTADQESGFLRTGDLGFLKDDELYVTGRISDLIIVAGRNLHPQDLEQSIQRVSALFGAGVAFPVESDREHVVLVQEVRTGAAGGEGDLADLATAVRERVSAEFAVQASGVVLVRPGTVRRTTSGKLARTAVRALFLEDRLEPLHELIDPKVRQLVRTKRRARPAVEPVRRAA
ncbi:MAG TPA: fatty acyl-AMP ligase [Actinocrinis sp.]|uniref:fatty acyl-AMP ligase n=1 Tax=Actinocrinis sp. TaxID=1920516 RepID=UPI002D245A58|nr:fatty acyl-AMP ligase [Actinocrinis sp.]HZU56476.1 fatty acyl-AMP ligase [Actinocrinis sp.]